MEMLRSFGGDKHEFCLVIKFKQDMNRSVREGII